MAGKKKKEQKKAGAPGASTPENGNVTGELNVAVKVGIIHTIADTIYASTARKIREAVANSLDNEASWVIVQADRPTKTLTIYDNGNGITKDLFEEIFQSLGYGLKKEGGETLA